MAIILENKFIEIQKHVKTNQDKKNIAKIIDLISNLDVFNNGTKSKQIPTEVKISNSGEAPHQFVLTTRDDLKIGIFSYVSDIIDQKGDI